MPNFTRPDGSIIFIAASDTARLRKSFSWENEKHIGTTLFKLNQCVQETIETTGPAMQAERASFTSLPEINNNPLWFDATKAGDARAPRPFEAGNRVQAIIPVGGIGMRVLVTVAEAQAEIARARAAV